MSLFRDDETAKRTLARLEASSGVVLPSSFQRIFEDNANADLALTNLERWLAATSSPTLHLQQLVVYPALAKHLATIFGASQPLTDSLIQNPELASIVLEPNELSHHPTLDGVMAEGEALLQNTTSYSHALDRLRFLKQRWTLPIVINDLAGTWTEESVWEALSDLAEAIIRLTVGVVWREYASQKELPGDCPVMVVGFGKLGGRELNYSSDIDLAYAIPDGLSEQFDIHATRFCELLGRAFSDRMGRGSLYRIDLRLRPYGSAGPLVASMRAFETYYRLYAEQWEVQALIRTRPMAGPPELIQRWRSMRKERCFRPTLSEPELEAMLAMKSRIEERADGGDLKRGAGGIRDVEFLVQALQLLHGHRVPALQTEGTIEVLHVLEENALLDHAVASGLREGYTFLRQLEHRCQLVGDQQTHSIPTDPQSRERLSKLMSLAKWRELSAKLEAHRRTIQTLYKSILQPEPLQEDNRAKVAANLGSLAPSVLQWFDSLPAAEAFYSSLAENRDSIERVRKIALCAPRLIHDLKESVSLTEMVLSGEVEEQADVAENLRQLTVGTPLQSVANAFSRGRATLLLRWTLSPYHEVFCEVSRLVDTVVEHVARRLEVSFDVIALGSYGAREMGFDSDADFLFLVEDTQKQRTAESQAQQFLGQLSQLKRMGMPFGVDLRLRPDGGKGMLVRSYEAFGHYDLDGMEMWERFALGQARLVMGNRAARSLVDKAAYAQPLTPDGLSELLAMKKRVETERVRPQYQRRDIKLGSGGLNDIEWLVHLVEMRRSGGRHGEGFVDMEDRIRAIAQTGELNTVEIEQLVDWRRYLLELRLRLALLGFEKDVIPENPDKLNRLAESMNLEDGNHFLSRHNQIIDAIRAIYLGIIERLRA